MEAGTDFLLSSMLYFVNKAAGILFLNTYPISCYYSICVANELEIVFMMTSYVNLHVFFIDKCYTFLLKKQKTC